MKKVAITFITAAGFLTSAPLSAQVAHRSADGYFYIRGLQVNRTYQVDLGGMPLIRAGNSNSCGILQFRTTKAFQTGDKIEIQDEKAQKSYGFTFSNLPTKETQRCNGQVASNREVWKTPDGALALSGLSPSSAQTIKLLSNNQTRNLRANQCGFIAIKLDNVAPGALIVEGKAYPTNVTPERGVACRRGTLYLAYPAPAPINPVPESTWKQQNPAPSFSPSTEVAAFNGNLISWGIVTNGGGGGSTQTDTGGGGSGGGGGNATQPQPPAGKSICKIGSSQLLVVGLQSGTNYYVGTPEDDVYSEEIADNNGRAIFDNINYNDVWEGESAEIELGKPSYQIIKNLGKLNAIPVCQ